VTADTILVLRIVFFWVKTSLGLGLFLDSGFQGLQSLGVSGLSPGLVLAFVAALAFLQSFVRDLIFGDNKGYAGK
jgi:hypothetical protein